MTDTIPASLETISTITQYERPGFLSQLSDFSKCGNLPSSLWDSIVNKIYDFNYAIGMDGESIAERFGGQGNEWDRFVVGSEVILGGFLLAYATQRGWEYYQKNKDNIFMWCQQRAYERKFASDRMENRRFDRFNGKMKKLFSYCHDDTQRKTAREIITHLISHETSPYQKLSTIIIALNPDMSSNQTQDISSKYLQL
ncbi:MAG: hypothetical protein KKC75_04505 [Nanoarchaeota archaeon]|nr:hypothetical protein [Nanoarchaeota archaeon]MBU1005321.1 hypothetical protein [Nanoarchaeota archaeon]MBU1945507.1 hypothetical protein [Nanoarchaeota archaeon]